MQTNTAIEMDLIPAAANGLVELGDDFLTDLAGGGERWERFKAAVAKGLGGFFRGVGDAIDPPTGGKGGGGGQCPPVKVVVKQTCTNTNQNGNGNRAGGGKGK
jgi:hypothetical protein